jgi:NAD(P)-dependent dehydrogenase (short-subunit alcohol dehydrogenase family)
MTGTPATPPPDGLMLPPGTFSGRTAIITGGGTGIGMGIASALGRLGADVVVASRKPEHYDEGASLLRDAGMSARGIALDIRDPDAIEGALDEAEAAFGRPVGLLVNNAAANFRVSTLEMSANAFRTVVDIVLNGTFHMSQRVARRLVAAGLPGSIVNVGVNYQTGGSPGTAHSAAAKAGVLNLTHSMSLEWARRNIRVNCCVPGFFPNPTVLVQLFGGETMEHARERGARQIPVGRVGELYEFGWAVSYLLSDYASFITGAVLHVDGGSGRRHGGGDFVSVDEPRPEAGSGS